MGLFKISPGIPDDEKNKTDFVPWESRAKCGTCDKPFYDILCEKHPKANECCYNAHLRKQHLKVVDII